MIFRALQSLVTTLVMAVRHSFEGSAPDHAERDPMQVDCLTHGKTELFRARQTACCGSMQWIPSGKVLSRSLRGRANEVVFR